MRGLIRTSVIFPAIVAGFGAGVLALWPIGAPESAAFPPGDAGRGANLARASGCVSCRSNAAAQGPARARGAPLDMPFATFLPPNITPHSTAGIGDWTVQDFTQTVRRGGSPDNAPYRPVLTHSFRTVPPAAEAAAAHDVGLPFSFRSGLKPWRAADLDAPNSDALMQASSPWNRRHLPVEGAAHSAACHTGRTLSGGIDDGGRLAGKDILPGGSMAEVVAEGTLFLAEVDRAAIATHLLDPEGTGAISTPTPPATGTPLASMNHSQMGVTNEI